MPPSDHLNGTELAAALGRERMYVTAMKAAGYRMEFGTRSTKAHAEAWLRAHPGFNSTDYFARHRKPGASRAGSSGRRRKKASAAGR